VRFLVDAQLPARLARLLNERGYDAVHTSELPQANRTPDTEIAAVADAEGRAVVTKDRDFRYSHFLQHTPRQLLLVRTGNISNDQLLAVFEKKLEQIVAAFDEGSLVELRPTSIAVRTATE
jgi:predicted nuclease of predicted toxin-antitoxin system